MNIPKMHLDEIHKIVTQVCEEKTNQRPRPIIAKVSFYKDEHQIKSHIKHLPKGKGLVCDDISKEMDEIRKELQKGKESQNGFLQCQKANY